MRPVTTAAPWAPRPSPPSLDMGRFSAEGLKVTRGGKSTRGAGPGEPGSGLASP